MEENQARAVLDTVRETTRLAKLFHDKLTADEDLVRKISGVMRVVPLIENQSKLANTQK
jgi:hypothetical protein